MLDPTADHIRELRETTGNDPVLLTVAPERAGAIEAIRLAASLGITIVGGLLVSQVLTLYSTPVIYLAFDRLAGRFAPHRREREAELQDAEVSAIHPFGLETE